MAYSTPSERWSSGPRRFFRLEPMDGLRFARSVWIAALAFYGITLLMAAATILPALTGLRTQDWTTIVFFVVPVLMRVFEPVLWLLVIRLVLEVSAVLLRERAERDVPPG